MTTLQHYLEKAKDSLEKGDYKDALSKVLFGEACVRMDHPDLFTNPRMPLELLVIKGKALGLGIIGEIESARDYLVKGIYFMVKASLDNVEYYCGLARLKVPEEVREIRLKAIAMSN